MLHSSLSTGATRDVARAAAARTAGNRTSCRASVSTSGAACAKAASAAACLAAPRVTLAPGGLGGRAGVGRGVRAAALALLPLTAFWPLALPFLAAAWRGAPLPRCRGPSSTRAPGLA